jgi:hypothetical protein
VIGLASGIVGTRGSPGATGVMIRGEDAILASDGVFSIVWEGGGVLVSSAIV